MRVSVIGEGFGARVVAPIYRQLGFETDVVSPRDSAAVERACAAPVNLVSIHSPPFLHHQHVMWALDHGRAVLCDKPFGRDAAEARAMRDRAVSLGLPNFLNFEFRRHPARAKAKALIEEGAIGELQHVSWTFIGSGLRRQTHRWLFDASLAGGWIGALGSHVIDALRWLFDSEVADCGGVWRIETPVRPDKTGQNHSSTAEDAFTAWFAMANGRSVSFDTAYSASVTLPQRLILMGSEGALELVGDETLTLRRPGEADATFAFPPPPGDVHDPALLPWLTEVRDALRDNVPLRPSFEDGVAVAEVMDRLRATLVRVGDGPR